MDISLEQALLGFSQQVLHLDRHAFTVASKPNQIIQPDEWIIIKGEGMPKRGNPTEFGDMHVKMKVRLPASLT
jgi:DnaJ family protein A protein 2